MALGNLPNELGPHGLHKLLALTNRHHERTQAANHAVAVVEVQVLYVPITTAFEHDRKAIDDDPPVEGLIPGVRDGSALVVSSIPADVYDAASSLHAAPLQEQNAIIDGRRD